MKMVKTAPFLWLIVIVESGIVSAHQHKMINVYGDK